MHYLQFHFAPSHIYNATSNSNHYLSYKDCYLPPLPPHFIIPANYSPLPPLLTHLFVCKNPLYILTIEPSRGFPGFLEFRELPLSLVTQGVKEAIGGQ